VWVHSGNQGPLPPYEWDPLPEYPPAGQESTVCEENQPVTAPIRGPPLPPIHPPLQQTPAHEVELATPPAQHATPQDVHRCDCCHKIFPKLYLLK